MHGYWIEFTDGTKGYCEGQCPYDAVRIAEYITKKKVKCEGGEYNPELPRLPYPASPVIWQFNHPVHGKCPTFCLSPEKCSGGSSCPRSYACSE